MKPWTLALALLLGGSGATAQERIPDEEAKKIAEVLVRAGEKSKAPLKVEADAARPYAKRKDDYGVLVLAAKGLDAKGIAGAKGDVAAVGQLWLKGLSPLVDERPA